MDIATLLNQYQKPLVAAASIALVVLMAVSLAQTTLFFIEDMSQADAAAVAPGQSQARPAANIDTSQIRDLFGVFQSEVVVVQENVPVTNLNLELQGIFTADDPDDSTAIVAQKGQSGQLYGIGDRLPGNATLEAVHPNYILIKRGARTEKLAFDDPSIGQGFARAPVTGNNVVLTPNGPTTSGTNPQDAISRLEGIQERIANRSREISQQRGSAGPSAAPDLRGAINDFQARLAEDPDTVLSELGVSASGNGFKIGGQVPAAMLRQAGLQEGDVILSVNGQDASNVAGNQQLMNQVMQSERARVEVQRGQRRFVVTVPIPKQ